MAGILAARDEHRSRENQAAAGKRRGGQCLAKEERAPKHAEERDEVGDSERARRADIGSQANCVDTGKRKV